MEEQVTKKKNMDYSGSAVKLCNPEPVLDGLVELERLNMQLANIQDEINSKIPQELTDRLVDTTKQIAEVQQDIKKRIDNDGSYQDSEMGFYAVKQERKTLSYKADELEQLYPTLAPAFVIKSVDEKMLEAMQKNGRVIDNARLEAAGALTVNKSYAYIIKV